MLRTLSTAALALGLLTASAGCDSSGPEPDEGELITRVEITLTNAAAPGDVVRLVANDPLASGNVTYTSTGPLRRGATYNAQVKVFDDINNEDISEEIEEEADEHLFVYAFDPATAGTITITDTEQTYGGSRALPVGLRFRTVVAAAAPNAARLNLRLYHFDSPKASATSVSDEIDVDLSFPVTFATPPATVTGGPAAR